MIMLNKKSHENIKIKKNEKNNKRVEYIFNNFATQFVQLWDAVVVESR